MDSACAVDVAYARRGFGKIPSIIYMGKCDKWDI